LTLNKALKAFSLIWITLLAIPNIIVVGALLASIKDLAAQSQFLTTLPLLLLVLFLIDAVFCTPALAAEWLRSIRIAKSKFPLLRK
jgi:hypothetical protein